MIAKIYFADRFKAPIIIMTEKALKNEFFLCYSNAYRADIFSKSIDTQFTKPKEICDLFKFREDHEEKIYNEYFTNLITEKLQAEKNAYLIKKRAKQFTEEKLKREL